VALFFLPTLHVIACVTIWIARLQSGVHYLIYVDFPCSLLLVMAGWRNDSFLFWFATLGTAWWYGLSYIGWRLLKA
jgi:hypothetical protein